MREAQEKSKRTNDLVNDSACNAYNGNIELPLGMRGNNDTFKYHHISQA